MEPKQPEKTTLRGRPDKITGETKSTSLVENLLAPDFAENVYKAALATRLTTGEAIFYISNGMLSPVHSLNSREYKRRTTDASDYMSTGESIVEGHENASIMRAIFSDLDKGVFGHVDDINIKKGLEFILHSHTGGHKYLYPSFADLAATEESRVLSRKLNLEAILTVEGDEVRVLFMEFSGNLINYYQDSERYRKAARSTDSMIQFLEQCGIRTHVLSMTMNQRRFSKESLRGFEAFLRDRTLTT